MAARKHHYVPQRYLKLFSVSHKKVPQLTVFDRVRKKVYKAGIDNVAAQRDFNAIDVEGMDGDAFEKSMSGFETKLADAPNAWWPPARSPAKRTAHFSSTFSA